MSDKKVVGIISLGLAILVPLIEIISTGSMDVPNRLPVLIILGIAGIILLLSKTKQQKRTQKEERDRIKSIEALKQGVSVALPHSTGLPLAKGASCFIKCNMQGFDISSSGVDFNLPSDKITILEIISNVDVQKHYVSSAGDAIRGAMRSGASGARRGGRIQEMTSAVTTYCLVINFISDNRIASICFGIPHYEYATTLKMKNHFSNVFGNQKRIKMNL